MPKTEAEFQEYLSGKKQPRPKILIHPTTGDYYRLVPKDPYSLSYGQGFYVKIDPPSTTIHFYEMYADKLAEYKDMKLKPLPEGYEIRSLQLQTDTTRPRQKNEISPRQLYALMGALGDDSGWWPTEDPNYFAHEYFSHLKINVMFHGDSPVAVHMWNDSRMPEHKEIVGSFIGTIPEYRGKGLGKYIIQWGLQKVANDGCVKYYLNTGDDDIMPSREDPTKMVPARILYEKIGFVHVHSQTYHPKDMKPGLLGADGLPVDFSKMTMSDEYYRHPNGQILGRYTSAAINERVRSAFMEK